MGGGASKKKASKGKADIYRLEDDEINAICKSFEEVDTNHDGHVDRGEMAAAMRRSGREPMRMEVELAFLAMDRDKSGTISKEEYVKYMSVRPVSKDDVLKQRFLEADKDNDGEITLEECQRVLCDLGGIDDQVLVSKHRLEFLKGIHLEDFSGQELIKRIFREMDDNGDGKVSLNDALAMFYGLFKISTLFRDLDLLEEGKF